MQRRLVNALATEMGARGRPDDVTRQNAKGFSMKLLRFLASAALMLPLLTGVAHSQANDPTKTLVIAVPADAAGADLEGRGELLDRLFEGLDGVLA